MRCTIQRVQYLYRQGLKQNTDNSRRERVSRGEAIHESRVARCVHSDGDTATYILRNTKYHTNNTSPHEMPHTIVAREPRPRIKAPKAGPPPAPSAASSVKEVPEARNAALLASVRHRPIRNWIVWTPTINASVSAALRRPTSAAMH